MNKYEVPQAYWETRLSQNFDLTGVGYIALGPRYNQRIYQARLRAFELALQSADVQIGGSSVLEIGPGTGFFTALCEQAGARAYLGIDITAVSVQNLSTRFPQFRFLQADIGDPAGRIDEQFDIVLAADVLYHIVDDDRFNCAITRLCNAVKPGGVLLISDLLMPESQRMREHCNWRSLKSYTGLLQENGLRVSHVQPIFGVLHPPVQMPGISWPWHVYSLAWRYGLLRLAGYNWFDNLAPRFLGRLDESFFMRRVGLNTPNSKWLVAAKDHVVTRI